jgi:FAD/FMN-containing dehydrogenase
MADEQSTGTATALDASALGALRSSIGGGTVVPGDSEYDAARAVWNGMVDRRPAVIARCSSTTDVVAAVNFAREQGLGAAIRGGGHNAAGNAVCDGGLVIDLSAMNQVSVDPATRTARAEGGATWGVFDRATAEHGLATTGGAISTTGIAGLTLGGGLGWLMRSYGMACDNLRSVEIVTADGQVHRASATENPDLFWGVRGGGGNFGVVTEFEFQLHPVETVLAGMLVHPAARATEALHFLRDFHTTAPDELTVFSGLLTSPDGMPIFAFIVCYNGPVEQGERVLAPLRAFGPPVADMIQPMPYVALQSMLDEGFPSGRQVYWRSDFPRRLSDELIDVLVEQYQSITSPLSSLLLEQFGGAVRRVGRDDTAFVHRDADFNLAIISVWTDPAESDRHIAWARGVHDAVRPFVSGTYVNYLGDEGADRVRAAYGDAVYDRLVALKNRYDPANLFRFNQNIRPTA